MEKPILLAAEQATTMQKVAAKSSSFLIYLLVSTLLVIVNIYLLIKFFANYKRNIDKTKSLLGEYLVKRYIQGINLKSNGFYNLLLIGFLILSQIILGAISLAKVIANLKENESYLAVFIALVVVGIIMLISFFVAQLAIYLIKFNYPQYKTNNKKIEEELESLKEFKFDSLNKEYPKNINIDYEKLQKENIILFNLFKRWMKFYNEMDLEITSEDKNANQKVKFQKKYNEFLNQLFKINYFDEESKKIAEREKLQQEYLDDISAKKEIKEEKDLNEVEKQIFWMKKMDNKVKILNEKEELKKLSKEEFNKKYKEYVEITRSLDPIYQSTQKNSWLFYRDAEVEDLFFNTHSLITYTLNNNQNTKQEKILLDFLLEYKEYLISKFLLTK